MPVIVKDPKKKPAYKPSKEDAATVLAIVERIEEMKDYRSLLNANEYDESPKARSIEELWDWCDYVALPHKYWHKEMRAWMSDNSIPLILSKIDTATSVLMSRNPEVEISARSRKFEKKAKVLEALYSISWDKGNGRQQMIKFINNMAKYGTAVGREYHRFEKNTIEEIVGYDPEEGRNLVKNTEVITKDEAYFECLPIRDCWFDNKAKPYDEDSMRDWCWRKTYEESTFHKMFPDKKFPNAKYVIGNNVIEGEKDKADKSDDANSKQNSIEIWFLEDKENDKFYITDGHVLIHEGGLRNHELSCVIGMWKLRNDQIVYGIGLCEILENPQNMLDKLVNTTFNQTYLSMGGAGYYGGVGNVTETDMILEPKLKKLKDADKIVFPKIPSPDAATFNMIEFILDSADEFSGVTKSLGGEQVGKTLGEAVLNREAGLRRLSTPLQNLEFALERHARLRVDNIQLIYSRPQTTEVIVNDLGAVLSPKLLEEYDQEKNELGENAPELVQKFPSREDTGEIFRNNFRQERLSFEKTNDGELEPSEEDTLMEITPSLLGISAEEIRGSYDVRIRAFSTLPMSKSLDEAKALETFNIVAPLPDTDIYKAEKIVLKRRNEDPDDWMKSEEDIIATQQLAAQAPPEEGEYDIPQADASLGSQPMESSAQPLTPPANLQMSQSPGGINSQVTQSLSG